jgi:hypothetical protein
MGPAPQANLTPSECLARIRHYTAKHAELQNAHHFLFDLPVGHVSGNCDAVVMGLNPRENDNQRRRWPITTEMRTAGKAEKTTLWHPTFGNGPMR